TRTLCLRSVALAFYVVDGFAGGDHLPGLGAADIDDGDAVADAHHLRFGDQLRRAGGRQVVDPQVDGGDAVVEAHLGPRAQAATGIDQRRDHAAVQRRARRIADELLAERQAQPREAAARLVDTDAELAVEGDARF